MVAATANGQKATSNATGMPPGILKGRSIVGRVYFRCRKAQRKRTVQITSSSIENSMRRVNGSHTRRQARAPLKRMMTGGAGREKRRGKAELAVGRNTDANVQ